MKTVEQWWWSNETNQYSLSRCSPKLAYVFSGLMPCLKIPRFAKLSMLSAGGTVPPHFFNWGGRVPPVPLGSYAHELIHARK